MTQPTNPPRENLVRALGEPPELMRDDGSNMPVLRGHFAVWDTPTEIRSAYEGHFIEKFAPGSMTKTLSEQRDRIKVLFQHGKDPQIADKPLGPIRKLEPDDQGAYYEVPMLDTNYNRELIPGLEANLYGASFRFQVISEEYDKKPKRSEHNPNGIPERTVTEAKVIEFGPVTFPAYKEATAGLRSMTDEFIFGRYLDDPERLADLLAYERRNRKPNVTVTYGRGVGATSSTSDISTSTTASTETPVERVEPEPPEATTPPQAAEPEPSEATTREKPGAKQHTPRFNSREEWLEWISRI